MTHSPARPALPTPTARVLLGLLGFPIAKSASPAMHEAAARAAGFEAHYHLIEVAQASDGDLRAMLDGVRRLGFAGINVTFPYKERVVAFLDELAPEAEAMRAVNTIAVRDGRLIGHNTDMTGFRTSYDRFVGERGPDTITILGAGGVGRAIAFALARGNGPRLVLFDNDHAKANDLTQALAGRADIRIAKSIEDAVRDTGGIINATPVGMLPNLDMPVPANLILASHWIVDVVYTPLYTPFLVAAHRHGAHTMTGRDLAIHQAMDAFKLFTGHEASESAMSAAFDRIMALRGTPAPINEKPAAKAG